MLDFIVSILFLIVGLVLGFYLLLLGRRTLVLTTAFICLLAVGGLLALILLEENSAWALTGEPDWLLLIIVAAAGAIGAFLGAQRKHIAAAVIGFFAGGYMGLWLYDISSFFIVDVANWPENTAFWVGVVILVITGLIGLYFTRRSEDVAVILVSVFVGTDLIIKALGLSSSKSFTAVIALSLALLGLVFQYAQYLREIKADVHSPFSSTYGTGAAPATEMFDLSDD